VSNAISRENLLRVIVSLAADEMANLRQREVPPGESLAWSAETLAGEEGPGSLALDSLGRIDVATRVNQFFHMHEAGIEDYLLTAKTLGEWAAVVAEALRLGAANISFRTSGSTGVAKVCTHPMAEIVEEAIELGRILNAPARIVSLVPPHHIYGFIFTVVLPEILGCEVLDARAHAPGRIRQELRDGDMIAATPHLWRYLAGSIGGFPAGVTGSTSTAPMPQDLAEALKAQGLSVLTEIYGSSETSGIGWRRNSAEPFQLLGYWSVAEDGQALRRGSTERWIALPDAVAVEAPGFIRPVGRRDGAVQVGGINVFPARVRDMLLTCPGVADAAVRAFSVGGDAARQRLKAFIVPTDAAVDPASAEAALRAFAAENLEGVERPAAYAFGSALPRNAMGKLQDWS
jgi:long-chain acyl-CoA synthetase